MKFVSFLPVPNHDSTSLEAVLKDSSILQISRNLGSDASQEIHRVRLQSENAGSLEVDKLHNAGIRCLIP